MIFWSFLIILVFLLVFVVAIRNHFMTWGWNFALLAIILYASLFKMTGTARDAFLFSTIEHVHGDVEVLFSMSVPHKFIYLLIVQKPGEPPYYLSLPWSSTLEQQLSQAQMEADQKQGRVHADADELSRWMAELPRDKKPTGADRQTPPGNGDANKRGREDNPDGYADDKEKQKKMFYPEPQRPNPLKDYRTTIEGNVPIPDARTLLEQQ